MRDAKHELRLTDEAGALLRAQMLHLKLWGLETTEAYRLAGKNLSPGMREVKRLYAQKLYRHFRSDKDPSRLLQGLRTSLTSPHPCGHATATPLYCIN